MIPDGRWEKFREREIKNIQKGYLKNEEENTSPIYELNILKFSGQIKDDLTANYPSVLI